MLYSERAGPMRLVTVTFGLLAVAFQIQAAAQPAINPNSELLAAVRRNNPAAVTALLDQGAAINSRNRLGDSPLLIAAKGGNTPLALLLVERGADVNQRNLAGVSPLMAAAFEGNAELARSLLAKGADTGPADRVKKTAAVYAAGNGHAEVLRMLFDAGVPVNQRYDNELTALMWASAYGRDDAVKLLLARGADVSGRDNRGKSAADMAGRAAVASSPAPARVHAALGGPRRAREPLAAVCLPHRPADHRLSRLVLHEVSDQVLRPYPAGLGLGRPGAE